jgi:phospholipid/cholesterol/gamma-HCH transport system substrate-binding protein
MNQRRLQIAVGLLVVVCGALLFVLLFRFAGQEPVFRRAKVYLVHFPEAPGVSPNTPIRKSGLLIGRVARVQLAEEIPEYADLGGVILTLEIDANRKIFDDEVCVIRRTLLGDAVLEFVRRRPAPPPTGQPAAVVQPRPGDQTAVPGRREIPHGGPPLKGEVFADPLEIVADLRQDLVQAAQGVRRASDEIAKFVSRANELLGREDGLPSLRKRIDQLAEQTGETLTQFRELVANINEVVGDPSVRAQLRQASSEIGPTLQEVKTTLGQVRDTFAEIEAASASARSNLDNLQQFSRALGDRGPVLLSRLEETLVNVERLSADLADFSRRLSDRRSTLGRLATDTELYDNLNNLVLQVDQLSRQLQPVVRDLRVFSDKVARNPEMLGVRGVLERSSGTKGVPTLAELDPEGFRAGLHGPVTGYRP